MANCVTKSKSDSKLLNQFRPVPPHPNPLPNGKREKSA